MGKGTVHLGPADGTLYAIYGSSPLAKTAWPMNRRDVRLHHPSASVLSCHPIALRRQMAAPAVECVDCLNLRPRASTIGEVTELRDVLRVFISRFSFRQICAVVEVQEIGPRQ